MSKKAEAFILALRELCQKHGVQLSTSEYDHLQVWDLEGDDDPLYGGERIEDRTKQDKS